MSDRRISQREARQLRKRVRELEGIMAQQRRNWRAEWPEGTCLGNVTLSDSSHMPEAVRVSRLLGHAVVVMENNRQLVFFALPADKAGA